MHQSLWQKFDQAARQWVPFSLAMFLMLFGLTPTYLPGYAPVAPMLSLIAIYFWSVYRPKAMGYGSAFAVGLLEDLLIGTPLGSTSLMLMLCRWIVFHQQKFFNGRPFHVVWAAFALVA
ncbi:MAG: rod shape-determining protein MreD, partial [Alphaproteobacteria bacterium]|nr:rod shape-determining protein MreD [Alphaproteobacteria bacterium]